MVDFRERFWLSVFFTIPILVLSSKVPIWFNLDFQFTGDKYLLFFFSSFVYLFGGFPFLKEVSKKTLGVKPLVAIAITLAYLYSSAVVFGLEGETYFWELSTSIVIILSVRWLEMHSILGPSKTLEALVALIPDEANLVQNEHIMKVKVSELEPGNIILIKPNEKVPADGIIIAGKSDFNENILTKVKRPVSRSRDEVVIGGTTNGNGVVKVEVKRTGSDTYLSKVIKMFLDAQKQDSNLQHLANKAARWLTILAIVVGFSTFITWLLLGKDLAFAVERIITIMLICSPHTVGFAILLVTLVSTNISAKNGLLLHNRNAFENLRKVSTIIFDEIGSLTKDFHEVARTMSLSKNYTETDILRYYISVKNLCDHHTSKKLQKGAKKDSIQVFKVTKLGSELRTDVKKKIDKKNTSSDKFIQLEKFEIHTHGYDKEGIETKVFLMIDKELAGFITLTDEVKETSFEAIKALKDNGLKVVLLTSDNKEVITVISKELKIDDYSAEVLPNEKLSRIKRLQEEGEFLAIISESEWDTTAFTQSNVSIISNPRIDLTSKIADIILLSNNPKDIASAISFGKVTYRKMIQNLIWATGYNLVALLLATGFISGLIISPVFGVILMGVSTILCTINAQSLQNKFKI
ncbi:MAG: heavy metal translocating P-type ATPase [Saprospiraceae bacterium]